MLWKIRDPSLVSIHPSLEGGVNTFQQFCRREGSLQDIFWRGAWLDGKGLVSFWRGFRVLEIAIINFIWRLLFDLLFTCRLKDISLVIFHLCFNLFRFIKSFFNDVLYILVIAYLSGKRVWVWSLTWGWNISKKRGRGFDKKGV